MNIFMWISTDDELNDVIEMRRRTSKEDGGGLGDRFWWWINEQKELDDEMKWKLTNIKALKM